MKKTVLLTCNRDSQGPRPVPRMTLYEDYSQAISRGGMLPIAPLSLDDAEQLAETFDALMLSGGGDIAPVRFNEMPDPKCGPPDDFRDNQELALFAAFMARKKPIFGVCRGMQIINVALGGTLFQHLDESKGIIHTDGVIHPVSIVAGTKFADILAPEVQVNSFHHQAVNKLGDGLIPSALSPDGIVEALEHATLPIAATQWHPERLPEDLAQQRLFTAFLAQI